MRQIMIDFDDIFVEFVTFDGSLPPTEELRGLFKDMPDVKIRCCTKYVFVLNYDESKWKFEELRCAIWNLLDDKYADNDDEDDDDEDSLDDKVKIIEGFVSGSKDATELVDSQDDIFAQNQQYMDRVVAGIEGTLNSPEEIARTEKVMRRIDELVGADEFKCLAKELVNVADEIKRAKAFEIFAHQTYLFSIGEGCGLSTYLQLIGDIIWAKNLATMSTYSVKEAVLGAYKEGDEPFSVARSAITSGTKGKIQVVCIDISEWMNYTDNRYFKKFLRLIEKHAGEFIVVFRVPFVDKDILLRIANSISDVLSVRTVSFPPFSQNELKQCALEQLKKYEFEINEDAWTYFMERISQEKNDGKFYGINTVIKVVKELVYNKYVANSKVEEKSKLITTQDTKALCSGVKDLDLSGEEMLANLVGVDSIKKRVEEIIAQIQLSMRENKVDRPCIHMRFVGNPGTGKTTVARIIGKMLKEKGVLSIGSFYEHTGREFCGRYIGETAPKTSGICREAYGSVLFIDEAYSLYRGDDNTKDFGREAIDTLIAEMENHRTDLVIIMAGYTDDMDRLMKGNMGLASRMPYTIEFPNFTRKQLADIFVSMAEKSFEVEEGLFDVAREFFKNLSDDILASKSFSNARYVRNLFERTWAKASLRCQLDGNTEVVLTKDDFRRASADKEFLSKVYKTAKIGF